MSPTYTNKTKKDRAKSPCGCGGSQSGAEPSPCGCGSKPTQPVCCDLHCFERPNYFCGHLLTDEDLSLEMRYTVEKHKLTNKYLHGHGVVCGIVQKTLLQRMLDYFHPLRGGADGEGWEFGGKIFFSETFRQILETEGVLRIEPGSFKTFVDGIQQDDCKDIDLEPDEMVYSTSHNIQVNYQ